MGSGLGGPELNEHALRHLKEALPTGCAHGYSSSRTCEIGLSEQAGFPYRSIIHLVEACVRGKGAVGSICELRNRDTSDAGAGRKDE